jgi:hypothetical protein
MGVYSFALAERHPGRVFSGQFVRCRRCTAAVFEGELHQIWQFSRSDLTSCAQVYKRLVAYIETLIVLSLYRRPSYSRIAAIADAHYQSCLVVIGIRPDV